MHRDDIFIGGKRIYLRGFTKKDISTWYRWFNDADVTEFMNKGSRPNTKSLQKEYLEGLAKSKNDVQLVIVCRKDKTVIGIVGIHKIDWVHRRGDVSVIIGDKNKWGKGLATEAIKLIVNHAFYKLNLHKLTAGMFCLNAGALKSFQKNGFVLEGLLRQHSFCGGRYVDVYALGLIRKNDKVGLICKQ